jgi:hypothetical protein
MNGLVVTPVSKLDKNLFGNNPSRVQRNKQVFLMFLRGLFLLRGLN